VMKKRDASRKTKRRAAEAKEEAKRSKK